MNWHGYLPRVVFRLRRLPATAGRKDQIDWTEPSVKSLRPRPRMRPGFGISSAILLAALLVAAGLQAQTGNVSTILGPGLQVTGTTAQPSDLKPMALALDSAGNLYTADVNNCVVWKTSLAGGATSTSLFAGEVGNCAASGSPVNANPASNTLLYPTALAVCNGHVYIATHGSDPGVSATNLGVGGGVYEVDTTTNNTFSDLGLKTTIAQAGAVFPVGLACSTDSNNEDHVWVSSYWYRVGKGDTSAMNGELDGLTPNGIGGWTLSGVNISLALEIYSAIAVNPTDGYLYGVLTSVDGFEGWSFPESYRPGGLNKILYSNTGTVTVATVGTGVYSAPSGLAFDASGNILMSLAPLSTTNPSAATLSSQIAKVSPGGGETVLAGNGILGFIDDVPGPMAELNGPQGLLADNAGNVYFADALNNRVRHFHPVIAGPAGLNLVIPDRPAQSATYGYQQSVLNPSTGILYYAATSNTVNAIGTGQDVLSPGVERILGVIPVGASNAGGSQVTLIVDPTRNLIYANNAFDGNLYVIDGAVDASTTNSTAYQVIATVPLNNPGAYLLAIDTVLNRIYVAGPNATGVSVVQGGRTPQLLDTIGYPASFIASIGVDSGSHTVYAVSNTGAGNGQQESLINITYDSANGTQSAANQPFPTIETVLAPDFVSNSIAVDAQTGAILASGAASFDASFPQTYAAEDISQVLPSISFTQTTFNYPPITTSLDGPDRTFYVTDFTGGQAPSSHAAMITGIDNEQLTSANIPVFGNGATPPSPQVYDIEPDTSSDQAWISAADGNAGGFVSLWNAQTLTFGGGVTIPNDGGGYLSVDSSNHYGFLMDDINHLLYLMNTPPWTPTPAPVFSRNGSTVTITATNPTDLIYYNTSGSPGWYSTDQECPSPCQVTLGGSSTTIHAIEGNLGSSGSLEVASDDVLGVFAAAQPSSVSLNLNSTTIQPGATDIVTAIVMPSSSVAGATGTVTFEIELNGSSNQATLCPPVALQSIPSTKNSQAVCNFTAPALAGGYTVTAIYSGDSLNESSSGTVTLVVNAAGAEPILSPISATSNVIAINQNNSGSSFNAFLNSDSTVGLVQNGAIAATCPTQANFPMLNGTAFSSISSGAVYLDETTSRIYLAMMTNVGMYLEWVTIDLKSGICTRGPLVPGFTTTFNNPTFGTVEMNVDPAQGNLYALVATSGAYPDTLYIVPTTSWSSSTVASAETLDYSATYGPVIIDSSTHAVYIDDLGMSAYGSPGIYATSGFFVYDPNHTTSGSSPSNLQWVVGYLSGSGASPTITPFNAGWLQTGNAGKLVLVNENTTATTTGNTLATPLTVLDTTKFSFFTNTQAAHTYNSQVYITPGIGLSSIAAQTSYGAIGASDIDAANDVVYVYGYNLAASKVSGDGDLLSYSLNSKTPETVLNASVAQPVLENESFPWVQLNLDSYSTELVLSSAGVGFDGALNVTSPICGGTPLSLNQLIGSSVAELPQLSVPSVNATTGYVYLVQAGGIEFVAPPATSCGAAPAAPTTTTAQATPSHAVMGENVTFVATVVPQLGSGNPGGVVNFTADDGTPLPAGTLASGTASITSSGLTVGIRTITATYAGNSSYLTSLGTVQVTIMPAMPTFSPAAGAILSGGQVTLTAASGTEIYYTLDESLPSTNSTLYSGPITITGTAPVTIVAIAVEGGLVSGFAKAIYTPLGRAQLAVAPGYASKYYDLPVSSGVDLKEAIDKYGNYFEVGFGSESLYSLDPAGNSAQLIPPGFPIDGMALGSDGATLYLSSNDSHVWSLVPHLSATTFSGSLVNVSLTFPAGTTESLRNSGAIAQGGPQQHLFVVDQLDQHILEFDGSGTYVQTLYSPGSQTPTPGVDELAVDSAGNLFVGLSRAPGNDLLMEIPAGGTAKVLQPILAGTTQMLEIQAVRDMTTDAAGNLYFVNLSGTGPATWSSQIYKIDPTGSATLVAGSAANASLLASGQSGQAWDIPLGYPAGIALNAQGQLFVGQGAFVYFVDTLNPQVSFGGNDPATETISLYNPYSTNTGLSKVSRSGTNQSDFQLGPPAGCSLTAGAVMAPSASCSIPVTYSASSTSAESAQILLTYAGPGSQEVILNGAPLVATTTTLMSQGTAVSGVGFPVMVEVTPASGPESTLTGSVTLTDTYTAAGSSAPSTQTYTVAANSTATVTLHGAGAHTLAGSYSGDSLHGSSTSQTLPITVTLQTPGITWGPSSLTLGSVLGAAQLNAIASVPGTFTYTPPAGTVEKVVGSVLLMADFTPSNQVDYSSASATMSVTVNKATPVVALTPSAATAVYGTAETLTITVTGVVNLVPTGSVTVRVDGTTSTVNTASSTSTANSSATFTFNAGVFNVGQHTVSAGYNGDSNYLTSANSQPTTFQITQAPTTVSLASSNTSTNEGSPVTLTATVVSNPAIPDGEIVSFLSGTTTLGTAKTSGGMATFSTAFANPGTYTLTANYPGDTNFSASTSATLLEVIATPDYTVAVQPPTLTIAQGQTGTATFTVTSVGGYSQPVSFSCNGLPAFTTCNFQPSTVTPTTAGATTVLTIQTDVSHPAMALTRPTDPMYGKRNSARMVALAGGCFGSVLMLGLSTRRKVLNQFRRRASALLLGALFAMGIGTVSCGGSSHKTPLGQVTLTITTSGGSQASPDTHVVSLQVNITK